jgi:DNA-binding CsgD family transcriptional regulator
MLLAVLKKYLFLNTEIFTGRSWYILSGIGQGISLGIVVATIHFFHNLYQIKARKTLDRIFLAMLVVTTAVNLSPYGAALNEAEGTIRFGPASLAASAWYMISFTYALALGLAFFARITSANKRVFVAGLLLFALVGYIESLLSFLAMLRDPVATMEADNGFLISSIPYALYGIFLMVYFLQFLTPAPSGDIELSDDLADHWGITGREREIIRKVLQGKSNADIASDLFISLATVKTHLHNIYQKMGVDSRFDLIARVRNKS